jgi:DNA polymerase I-like protein with 3'-5' exonuclease and polymerase domains
MTQLSYLQHKHSFSSALPDLSNYRYIAIDLETYDPDLKKYGSSVRTTGYICGIAIAVEDKSLYFPIRHKEGFNYDASSTLEWLKKELDRERQIKIGANILYDLDYLAQVGIHPKGFLYDVQLAEALLDENRLSYSLDAIGKEYFGKGKEELGIKAHAFDYFGKKANPKSSLYKMPSELVAIYAIKDAELTRDIYLEQKQKLIKDGLSEIFILESELIRTNLAMRRRGVKVALEKTEQMFEELDTLSIEKKKSLDREAGYDVQIYSARSLAKYCDANNINYLKTAKSKEPKIDKYFLAAQQGHFFSLVKELREIDNFKNTFLRNAILDSHINGRIHCNFNQLRADAKGTVSGRFSCTQPNLQQIPARTELGKKIRSLFIPDEGSKWIKLDYSQIEPRLTLHYAKGREAEEIRRQFYVSPHMDAYTPLLSYLKGSTRATVKMIYLGLCYGMGKTKLCKQLGVEDSKGLATIATFNEHIPYIKNLSYEVQRMADNSGHIKTLSGRKRRFNKFEPKNNFDLKMPPLNREDAYARYGRYNIKRAYTYKALNSLIQGGSADILKKAMLDYYKSGLMEEIGAPLLTIHDELDFSVPEDKVKYVKDIKDIMCNSLKDKLTVPLWVDVEQGDNWGELHDE